MKYQLDVFIQETKEVVSSAELELEVEPKNILLKQGYGYRLVNLEENKFKLDDVSTKELVDELKKREGVEYNVLENSDFECMIKTPFCDESYSGPGTTILIVQD